jgi:hypothetical protein
MYGSTNQFPLFQPDNAKIISKDTLERAFNMQGLLQLGPKLEPSQLPNMEEILNRHRPAPTPTPPPPPIPDLELIREEEEDMAEDELHIYLHIEVAYNRNRTEIADIFEEISNLIDESLNSHSVENWRVTTVQTNNYEDDHQHLLEQVQTVIDDAKQLRTTIRNQ